MADFDLQFKLTMTEGVVTMTNAQSTKSQTRESTLTKIHHTIQSVGTGAEEAIDTGDVDLSKQHWVLLVNRDASNYVIVSAHKDGSNQADAYIMLPGEPFFARCAGQSGGYPITKVQADTAACDVEVLVGEAGDPTA